MSAVAGEGDTPVAAPAEFAPPAPARWVPLALGILMTAAWVGLIWTVPHLHADPVLHEVARFAHVAALILGFGAVLAVDWFGLRWLLGRRKLADVFLLARNLATPTWAGLAVLTVSGLVLHPDLTGWPTRVKLGAVLLIGLNGLYAQRLGQRLETCDATTPRPVLMRAAICGAVSQIGWWTATVIGFLNAHH